MPNDPNEIVDIDENRLIAALSYVGVLVVVPWLMKKDDPFVNWHIKQGLVILAGLILALLAASWHGPSGSLVFVLLILADIAALAQTLLGRRWKIPGIGQIAEKFRI